MKDKRALGSLLCYTTIFLLFLFSSPASLGEKGQTKVPIELINQEDIKFHKFIDTCEDINISIDYSAWSYLNLKDWVIGFSSFSEPMTDSSYNCAYAFIENAWQLYSNSLSLIDSEPFVKKNHAAIMRAFIKAVADLNDDQANIICDYLYGEAFIHEINEHKERAWIIEKSKIEEQGYKFCFTKETHAAQTIEHYCNEDDKRSVYVLEEEYSIYEIEIEKLK